MKTTFPEAVVLAPEDLRVGLSAQFERDITEADVYAFAQTSGDANPLHVDPEYACQSNFAGRVVHGAFQVALASALIGMRLPGRNVLLGSVNAKFPTPLYYPCRVSVSGQISSWNPQSHAGSLKVTVRERATQTPTAEIHLSFTLHEKRPPQATVAPTEGRVVEVDQRETVLVTGASGGVASQLIARLAERYTVIALRRQPGAPAAEISQPGRVLELIGDLRNGTWRQALEQVLGGRRLYGIVHAAWPGLPHGGLLQVDPVVIEEQLSFGVLSTTELARFLFTQSAHDGGHQGGRLIVLSSIAATRKPALPLASYSLGKAALEHTARLLAPELARRKITINVVSPSFIAVGMNKQSTERQQLKEEALIPLGRLCRPDDVAGLVQFLLSPEAAFISGEIIGLSGAQL